MAKATITHPFWLVFERSGRPLTLALTGSGVTLPVFSFAEEAERFVRSAARASRLRVAKVAGRDLISLISDPRPGFDRVALDPSGEDRVLDLLVGVDRRDFLGLLGEKVQTGHREPPESGSGSHDVQAVDGFATNGRRMVG